MGEVLLVILGPTAFFGLFALLCMRFAAESRPYFDERPVTDDRPQRAQQEIVEALSGDCPASAREVGGSLRGTFVRQPGQGEPQRGRLCDRLGVLTERVEPDLPVDDGDGVQVGTVAHELDERSLPELRSERGHVESVGVADALVAARVACA